MSECLCVCVTSRRQQKKQASKAFNKQHFESLLQVGASPFKRGTPVFFFCCCFKSPLCRGAHSGGGGVQSLVYIENKFTRGSRRRQTKKNWTCWAYIVYGGYGQPCFPLPQASQCTEGCFFFFKNAMWKEGMVLKGDFSRISSYILTRARVCVPLYWILTRSSADLEASRHYWSGPALPCFAWLAWRSTELASHLGPPSSTRATCLLALSSGPPWPTSKTPRKNMPWHRLNTGLTSFRRWLRSAAVNKIAMKNKWKIIMPTPKHQTIPYIPAGRVQK